MAHFAKIENNIVLNVVAVRNEIATDEAAGIAHLAAMGLGDNWVQTSYNGNFRGKFAAIGDKYENGEFVSTRIVNEEEDEQLD